MKGTLQIGDVRERDRVDYAALPLSSALVREVCLRHPARLWERTIDGPRYLRLLRELGLDAKPWRVHERVLTFD